MISLEGIANLEGTVAGSLKLAQLARWGVRRMLGLKYCKVEFIARRPELQRKYPIERFLVRGNDAYLCWLSGQGVLTGHKEYWGSKCIKMLLLPNPKSDYVLLLTESLKKDSKGGFDFPTQIETTTRTAQENRVPVRWLKSYTGLNLTIINPERSNGFVHIEPCLPHVQPDDRFSFRFEKQTRETEILALYEDRLIRLAPHHTTACGW